MLVLTRRVGETFIIGDSIRVTLAAIDVEHGRARLAIEAPKGVPVYREEVYQAIREEMQQAARSPVPDLARMVPGAPTRDDGP